MSEQIVFRNKKEFNQAVNRKFKPLINEEIKKYHANLEQAKIKATEDALMFILPLCCTVLNEVYGFGSKRQEKFIEYFIKHMECLEEGVTDIEQYKEYCKENRVKFFDVVEVER